MKTFLFIFLISSLACHAQYPFSTTNKISEPLLFGESVISSPDRETGCAFSPDGKRVFFAKWSLDFKIAVMCYSDYENGKWQEPKIVPFSGKYHEQHPFVTPDGSKLYFISSRPFEGERSGFRIWYVDITADGFGDPVMLGEEINKAGYSTYTPSLTEEGTLYFCRKKAYEGTADVFYAKKDGTGFKEAVRIKDDSINSQTYNEWHAFISPNGKVLVFTSEGRPKGKGKEDLYVVYKQEGKWVSFQPLSEKVNAGDHDYLGYISPDNKYFFYSSIRPKSFQAPKEDQQLTSYTDFVSRIRSVENGQPNLYIIDLDATGIDSKFLK